eukprot:4919814-Prymnesium_polylepis.1
MQPSGHEFAEAMTTVIAHRGLHEVAPENSLRAAAAAIGAGASVVECDAHLSAVAGVIVIHDTSVDRTTNGTGAVAQQSQAELASLRLTGASPPEGVPTLAELIRLIDGRARLLIELKWAS